MGKEKKNEETRKDKILEGELEIKKTVSETENYYLGRYGGL